MVALVLVTHFVFAMQYLTAALNLPIIMNIFNTDSEQRLNRSKRIMLAINACYYCVLTCFIIVY